MQDHYYLYTSVSTVFIQNHYYVYITATIVFIQNHDCVYTASLWYLYYIRHSVYTGSLCLHYILSSVYTLLCLEYIRHCVYADSLLCWFNYLTFTNFADHRWCVIVLSFASLSINFLCMYVPVYLSMCMCYVFICVCCVCVCVSVLCVSPSPHPYILHTLIYHWIKTTMLLRLPARTIQYSQFLSVLSQSPYGDPAVAIHLWHGFQFVLFFSAHFILAFPLTITRNGHCSKNIHQLPEFVHCCRKYGVFQTDYVLLIFSRHFSSIRCENTISYTCCVP